MSVSITDFSNTTTTATSTPTCPSSTSDSLPQTQTLIESLFSILHSSPPSLFFLPSANPTFSLLHDSHTASHISNLLRQPDSGAGDNKLCQWLYDAFQSGDPNLQLIVLSFIPIVAGVYLSRTVDHHSHSKPLAGFEAILLALYAHETNDRGGHAVTVIVPDLDHPSLYHETREPITNTATGYNLAVVSPSLEPHGNVRATRRARIVGIALEMYYKKISEMPVRSKIDFCEFCEVWAGQDGHEKGEDKRVGWGGEGRFPLPWELMQPVLRILGHCLLGPKKDGKLFDVACGATRSLSGRSMHDMNAKAVLATGSLLSLGRMSLVEANNGIHDPSETPLTNVIAISN